MQPFKKGKRVEYAVVEKIRAAGFNVRRIPLSGALKEHGMRGDIKVNAFGKEWLFEVKGRKNLRYLYGLMARGDRVVLVDDGATTFKLMTLSKFLDGSWRLETALFVVEIRRKELTKWLKGLDGLIVKANYKEPLVLIPHKKE